MQIFAHLLIKSADFCTVKNYNMEDKVINSACKAFNIPKSRITENTRKHEVSHCRFVVMHYLSTVKSYHPVKASSLVGAKRCSCYHANRLFKNFDFDNELKEKYNLFLNNLNEQ